MPVIAPLQRANHGSHFRAYGLRGVAALIDPFLGVDHAWMSAPTFPPHSHAGFSAVSYLFLDSETGVDNRDSLGTRNLIRPGGLHWATAGSGIVHEEVPAEAGKTVHSLQIFVNLAASQKDIAPFALPLEPEDVPVVQLRTQRDRDAEPESCEEVALGVAAPHERVHDADARPAGREVQPHGEGQPFALPDQSAVDAFHAHHRTHGPVLLHLDR